MRQVHKKDSFFTTVTMDKELPIEYVELEKEAQLLLDSNAFGYIQSGAGSEKTLRNNRSSFERNMIIPRFLTDVSTIDTSIRLFNRTYQTPILFAPIGMQKLAHEDGEIASSKAAGQLDIPFIQSTVSSYSIEDITAETKSSSKWFQLYWSRDEEIACNMVKRAEANGYEAIVVTVDTVQMGWRVTDMKNQFSPLKQGFGKANYEQDPVFMNALPDRDKQTIIDHILTNIYHPNLQWEHIRKLQEITTLPILLKGILHPADARAAVECGIDGIIVSNHGGRQLDGVISSIDALPTIVKEVDGRIPVLFDSGIRDGTDIIKALMQGAHAVCVGRPYIYALALDGQTGVRSYMRTLIDEFKTSMALTGATTIEELRNASIYT